MDLDLPDQLICEGEAPIGWQADVAGDARLEAPGQEEARLLEGADPIMLTNLAQVPFEIERELIEAGLTAAAMELERSRRVLETIERGLDPGLDLGIRPGRLVERKRDQHSHLLEDLAHRRTRIAAGGRRRLCGRGFDAGARERDARSECREEEPPSRSNDLH